MAIRNETNTHVGKVIIQDSIDIDSEVLLKARREQALKDHPDEDPDLRFPIFDVRSPEIRQRTADANRNLLRMHRAIQILWEDALLREKKKDFKYDFVLFMRDDTFWLSQFSLDPFVSEIANVHKVFVPSCDANDPPLDENELNDHMLLSRRSSADVFGNYYSNLFDVNIKECMERLPVKITKHTLRGCNSEMLLKWVIDRRGIDVGRVAQGVLPFQRSVNVKLLDESNLVCFHKFCQSQFNPVSTSFNGVAMEKCSKINM